MCGAVVLDKVIRNSVYSALLIAKRKPHLTMILTIDVSLSIKLTSFWMHYLKWDWSSLKKADFQNVSCFVFEQSIVFLKAAKKMVTMFIFNAVKKQSGIGSIVDALFCNFAYIGI